MHTATDMAHGRTATHLPAGLLWPFDCRRRCDQLVRVDTGPDVANELTRQLRDPFKSALREEF